MLFKRQMGIVVLCALRPKLLSRCVCVPLVISIGFDFTGHYSDVKLNAARQLDYITHTI